MCTFSNCFNKYVAIFIIMHIASLIGGQQQNMRQCQIMSLVPHPQIGPFYEQIWLGQLSGVARTEI